MRNMQIDFKDRRFKSQTTIFPTSDMNKVYKDNPSTLPKWTTGLKRNERSKPKLGKNSMTDDEQKYFSFHEENSVVLRC